MILPYVCAKTLSKSARSMRVSHWWLIQYTSNRPLRPPIHRENSSTLSFRGRLNWLGRHTMDCRDRRFRLERFSVHESFYPDHQFLKTMEMVGIRQQKPATSILPLSLLPNLRLPTYWSESIAEDFWGSQTNPQPVVLEFPTWLWMLLLAEAWPC